MADGRDKLMLPVQVNKMEVASEGGSWGNFAGGVWVVVRRSLVELARDRTRLISPGRVLAGRDVLG
jgi:hypothetical protein